jgi:hypothetical protein
MPREGPEAVPYRGFERVRELVLPVGGPDLDGASVEMAQDDRAGLAARASASAEGNQRARHAASFELRPRLVAH